MKSQVGYCPSRHGQDTVVVIVGDRTAYESLDSDTVTVVMLA